MPGVPTYIEKLYNTKQSNDITEVCQKHICEVIMYTVKIPINAGILLTELLTFIHCMENTSGYIMFS